MNSLNIIKQKPWLVSLVCALFLLYPNIAWFLCDISFVDADEHNNFIIFFCFRALYIWGMLYLLIVLNIRLLHTLNFFKRVSMNMGIALGALGLYLAVTMLTHFNYDNFVSIVVFQFIIVWLNAIKFLIIP